MRTYFKINMKQTTFLVSDEALEAIRQMGDRKLPGRIWFESHNGKDCLRFEPYRRHNSKGTHLVISIVVVDASKLNVEPTKSNKNVTL